MGSQRNLKLRLEDLGLAVYGFSGSRVQGFAWRVCAGIRPSSCGGFKKGA